MTIFDNLANYDERPALIFPGRSISYAELAVRVERASAELGEARQLVSIEALQSEHAIIAYLAALRGGHAVALLQPADSDRRADFENDFMPDVTCRMVDGRWRYIAHPHKPRDLHPDLALLLGTSGSTGKSRYVRLSRGNLEANAASIGDYLGLTRADCAALILPFHYSYGLSVLNSHLAVGAAVFVSSKGVLDPGFVQDVRAAGCTNIAGVPYSYELLEKIQFRKEKLPALRLMTVAGGRMPVDLIDIYRRHLNARDAELFVMYGQTEATARIAYVPPRDLQANMDTIGRAIPGGSLSIVGQNGEAITEPGISGELVYRGPNVMMGYASCRGDLARGHECAELRTGDLAECRANGFFRIVGRMKRMSKVGGLRIGHEAVEHVLAQRGFNVAVSGDDQRLIAAYAGCDRLEAVRSAMIEASGLTALHVDVVQVDDMPRLASGKIDYAAVGQLKTVASADARMMDAFASAFYPRRIAETDSFLSLGGDSLLYVQLSLMLERKLGLCPAGWEAMPFGELAKQERKQSAWRSIETHLGLRAAAILLVVIHHATLWPIPGGAALLMTLVGYNLARFQGNALTQGELSRPLKSLGINLLVYLPLVLGYCLARGEVLWPSLLLIGNLALTGPERMVPYLYWFVEAYAQTILVWVGLFSLAPVRRAASADPFKLGCRMLAVSIAAKYVMPLIWTVGAVQIFTLPDVFYLSVFGWCVFFARSARQKAVLLGAAMLIFPVLAYNGGNWVGSWVKFSLQVATIGLLLYVPRVWAPKQVAAVILPIAAAGYHIYLFHRLLPEWLLPEPVAGMLQPLLAATAITLGVATGLVAWHLQKLLTGALIDLRKRRDRFWAVGVADGRA